LLNHRVLKSEFSPKKAPIGRNIGRQAEKILGLFFSP
jgi:hypothetical protein